MWIAAALGWCAPLRSRYGFGFPATDQTTPAVDCGHGFPSLSKEGTLSAELRDRNQLVFSRRREEAVSEFRLVTRRLPLGGDSMSPLVELPATGSQVSNPNSL